MDRDELQRRTSAGELFSYQFFWGHRPSKDGRTTSSCLSQWYAAPFTVDGHFYPTAEHWMMASKARLFDDLDALHQILAAPDPGKAKSLGRKVRRFDPDQWTQNARRFVTEGNLHKFRSHPALRGFLLSTSPHVLVEASPSDVIWGIGLPASSPLCLDPSTWRGQNLLGFALMDVREALGQESRDAGGSLLED